MQRHNKAWSLAVFSSGNVLKSYTIEQLVGLGISWVWMGLEGESSRYAKLRGVDTRTLVRTLQSHGTRILGSSIIGLEDHTPDNIDRAIDYATEHETDFHQFMLYTPIAGTAMQAELAAQGRMKNPNEFDAADIHGQAVFNYRHRHIPAGMEGELLVRAFQRDFDVNGPSVIRIARTTLAGWQRYKRHPDLRIRDRMAWEARELGTTYAAAIGATRLYYRAHPNPHVLTKVTRLLTELYAEFGFKARLAASFGGRYVWWKMQQEQRRLQRGWTYEPPTFFEVNEPMKQLPDFQSQQPRIACCQSVALERLTQRLKQSGMTWTREGGRWIVDLRVVHLSGIWPQVYQSYLRARMDGSDFVLGLRAVEGWCPWRDGVRLRSGSYAPFFETKQI